VSRARPTRSTTGERYRRSPGLVLYWRERQLACFDALTSTRTTITPDITALLDQLTRWTTSRELVARDPALGSERDLEDLLEHFARFGLVERKSASRDTWHWRAWSPEAAFFHFGTRGGRYRQSPEEHDQQLRKKAKDYPPPPPTKLIAGPRRAVPPPSWNGATLARTLEARRTWRQFGRQPISFDQIGSLLHATFGVQQRKTVRGQGPIVLKTSPSGGARHSIEAYVLALKVAGLPRGAYHYDAARHELVTLDQTVTPDAVVDSLADQCWFANCGALVVMTAIFERAMWRYPFNRAYRAVLAEAGHLGQTFCLVATALNLAPFCTMAFRDRELEAMIGIDGVTESAMYVVGAGTKPGRRVVNPGKIERV
jgi:SagB-type dehydrogenase family enzyme